jgi:hypothetical protein
MDNGHYVCDKGGPWIYVDIYMECEIKTYTGETNMGETNMGETN